MNDFIFYNSTKVMFGRNQMEKLPGELLKCGKNVLMVYGGGSIKRNGLYEKLMKLMKDADINVVELAGVEPNPRHTTVNKGAAICIEHNIHAILAVGGGSTIDCAKGIAATALSETDDVWDLVTGKVKIEKALPIFVALTMAATGSEMDNGAVISNMKLTKKEPLVSPALQPRVSFEDPINTFSVPAYQTACGSVDIMSHIFDVAYFSADEQMDMLTRLQEEVLKTVVKYAPVALVKPDDYEARANLMWAASWALNGFLYGGIAQATVCHMMEHELSAYYDITHGHGLAIITTQWLRYILDETTAPAIRRFGVRVLGVDSVLCDMDGAEAAIEALEKFFFETLGLKKTLTELNITDEHFAEMAESSCHGGVMHSLKDLMPKDVEAIYRMCL